MRVINDTRPYYYKVLDVSTDAIRDEIKKAYRRLSMLCHLERPPTRMPRRTKEMKSSCCAIRPR